MDKPFILKRSSFSDPTLQRVEDGEEVNKGQVERPPGEQSEAPGEAEQDDEAAHAAHVRHHASVRSLVLRVLPLDPTQLDHDHDEDQQAHGEDRQEVRHHAHVEGDVVTQPTATGGHKQKW